MSYRVEAVQKCAELANQYHQSILLIRHETTGRHAALSPHIEEDGGAPKGWIGVRRVEPEGMSTANANPA